MILGKFSHGLPGNKYNKHAWIAGKPEIGEEVWIGAFTLIDALYAPLKIGKGANISSGVQILTHSTVRRCVSERRWKKIDSAPTVIGDFCFIGSNAVILKGANLGHHSVVAAGAVVLENSKIPPYSLLAGVPAKIIGSSKKFLKEVEIESVSIVIPAYNEQATIAKVVKEALSEVKKIVKDFEIVIVNDGSNDRTGKIADSLSKKNKKVRVIHHSQNKGFSGAIKTALYSARKHLVFLAPADGQFDFKELAKFLDSIRGYDIALGYRKNNYQNILRIIYSKVFHFISKLILQIPFREFSTVIMVRRRILEKIKAEAHGKSAAFLPEFIVRALKSGSKFVEVPINWNRRRGGSSKAEGLGIIKIILKTIIDILLVRVNLFRGKNS